MYHKKCMNGKQRRKKHFVFFTDRFPRYKEMRRYMCVLAKLFSNYVKLEIIGKSYEGRDIYMIKISKFRCKKKRDITFIDANIHAREWLSSSTILYFIDFLLWNKHVLNLMDFYIVPCLNPDGYEYTHTQDRLWRKNMNPNFCCDRKKHGVDLNRNFPFGYGRGGSSGDPASYMYRGECPLSEPESQALASALNKYASNIKLYISVHCYGNVIIYPWGFTKEPVKDQSILEECGNAGRKAMMAFKNRAFKVGTAAQTMYILSGCSADYAKGCHNIKFAYTIELQKCGKSGFTPSTRRIVEIGEETSYGIVAMVKFVYKYYKGLQKKKCAKFANEIT